MAKEKKPSAASKPARRPATKKQAATPAQQSDPLVDTSLAAANAARMLAARAKLGAQQQPAMKESGSFKQLKQSLNRPAGSAVSAALGNAFGEQKSNLPTAHSGQQQVAHNQTQASFKGVPRRTAG